MQSADPFNLQRFVEAQGPLYGQALAELRAARKRSHWMWFVFPQIRGLGSSVMSARFALHSIAEAAAYLSHPVLGARLKECVAALNALPGHDAAAVLGGVDAMKLHSSLTLFIQAAGVDDAPFRVALDRYFGGQLDEATMTMLGTSVVRQR